MLFLINLVLTVGALLLFSLTAMLGFEIFAARRQDDGTRASPSDIRPSTTVLIPAHDEQGQIAATIHSLMPQLGPSDGIVVIADNCTDDTAAIARSEGVTVLERSDTTHRGKGYALQFGLDHLAGNPPDVVIVLDADCHAGSNMVETLGSAASATHGPVQALNLMEAGPKAGLGEKLAAFAFTVKNQVRPTGLARLGLPCALTGTGMAIPWDLIRETGLGTGHIVEDMKLGIDFIVAGHPPRFDDRTKVTSRFPTNEAGRTTQRRRWEHGHISMIADMVPPLIGQGIRDRRGSLLAVALDLMIPPLSLLVILLFAVLAASVVLAAIDGSVVALYVTLASLVLAVSSLMRAWSGYGRDIISARELLSIPLYIARKLPLYFDFFRRREREWVRTARDDEHGDR